MPGTAVQFTFVYQHGDVRDGLNGMVLDGLRGHSVHLEDTNVTGNAGTGVRIKRSDGQIVGGHISSNRADGLALAGGTNAAITGTDFFSNGGAGISAVDSQVIVDGSQILSNGTSGMAVSHSRATVDSSTLCFNGTEGLLMKGASSLTANGNILDVNGPFDVRNLSHSDINAQGNDWGVLATGEMERHPFPTFNITRIFDHFDSSSSGFVDYSGFVDPPTGCQRT